jgi:hypothetical protein
MSTISEAFLIAVIFSSGMYAAKKSRLHFKWIRVQSCSGWTLTIFSDKRVMGQIGGKKSA